MHTFWKTDAMHNNLEKLIRRKSHIMLICNNFYVYSNRQKTLELLLPIAPHAATFTINWETALYTITNSI